MATAQGSDVQINGGGTLDSGSYRTVTINGVGTIRGDIACETLRINGATTASGEVRAGTVEVNGTARIDGSLQAQSLVVNGETTLSRGAGIGTVTVKGQAHLLRGPQRSLGRRERERQLLGDGLLGDIVVEGIASADRFVATTVKIGLHGPSSVRAIEARKVTVVRGSGWAGLSVMAMLGERRLTSDVDRRQRGLPRPHHRELGSGRQRVARRRCASGRPRTTRAPSSSAPMPR